MTVEHVFADFFRREGWPQVTHDPADLGGLTKGGVTFRSFNRWRVEAGERALTPDEFRLIDQIEAQAFLRDTFLRPLGFIDDEALFVVMADWAMHAGVDDPVKALQTTLAARGHYAGAIDGIPGPKTRAAWAAVSRDLAVGASIERSVVKARIAFHVDRALDTEAKEFIRTHPTTQLRFVRGWVNRALEFV